MSDQASRIANLTPKQRALLELRRSQAAAPAQAAVEPIAVIGVGCRFPGGVTGPESFWNLLRDGVDAITEVPSDRWDIDAYYDPNPDVPGKMYTRWGGFLNNVDQFDARFFGITPREAISLDPQQRLLLEVSWEALEHAGQPPVQLAGTKTGVFVGMMTSDYSQLNLAGDRSQMDVYSGSGVDFSFAAGRLSYVLGVQGPSMVIATACSSSLVAAHLACQSLRAGECQLALAGGVGLILTPEATLYSCRIHSMAADGRCKTFDAAADGYVRGEGCGIVVLKRLAHAVRDGDRILALIRGSAANHDGKSAGLTVPNAAAQQAVIRSALAHGGVHPNQVGYVEAHGTGTPLGDPIELRSLWSVLSEGRTADQPLWVGSAKTNMGHLEAAAGAVGLIKTVLALQHREIPPHLHLQTPSRNIEWGAMRIEIPHTLTRWPAINVPAIAGVSSFGLSGMNAHVVLEEAPQEKARVDNAAEQAQVLPLSARTPAALRALAEAYRSRIDEAAISVADICYTASVRRSHFEQRHAIVGSTAAEFRAGLDAFLQAPVETQHAGPARKVAFVFPGQGGQYAGMARQLLASEPVFRQEIEACEAAFRSRGNWQEPGMIQMLERAEGWETEIERVQPALFAVQVALAALWQSWGIQPDAVIGHSMGEIAAAYVAGILTMQDAAQIISRRSALLKRIRGRGGMLLVELPLAEMTKTLAGRTELEVAASNGPRTSVVAGDVKAVENLAAELERQGIFCRRVQVDVASHSRQVEPLEPLLEQALDGVAGRAGTIVMYSTVTGAVVEGEACDRSYWMRNLRQRVQFWEALQAMAADGFRMFVELSPHPVLGPSIDEGLRSLAVVGQVRASSRRGEDERRVILETLAALYEQGQTIAWPALYPKGGGAVDLPTYPWQRERFWIATANRAAQEKRADHPLLGERHEFSEQPGTHVWELTLGAAAWPHLMDHRIEGLVVVPAAVYVELALAAGTALFGGGGPPELEQLRFQQMLVLPEQARPEMQVVVHHNSANSAEFQIASRPASGGAWTIHATGRIRPARSDEETSKSDETIRAIQTRCPQFVSGSDYYAALAARGLEYGPAFQGLAELWRQDGETLARLRPANSTAGTAAANPHPVDAVVLDACFQSLGFALSQSGDDGSAPAVPVGLERLQIFKRLEGDLWAYARIPDSGSNQGDVLLLDSAGQVVARMSGFRIQKLARTSRPRDAFADWLFEIQWQPQKRATSENPVRSQPGFWLLFADRGGTGGALARSFEKNRERSILVHASSAYKESAADRYELDPLDPQGFRNLVNRVGDGCRGVIHLWGLDTSAPSASAQLPPAMSVVHLTQALGAAGWRDLPRLWLITRGAQSVSRGEAPAAPEQATLWGLARTLAMEHSELACTRIDLSPDDPAAAEDLRAEIESADREDQIALRGSVRYVARLARFRPQAQDPAAASKPAGEHPFRLEIDTPGILDKLTLRASMRRQPGPRDVEIEVQAAGLNFLDVLSAMGIRPDTVEGPTALGGECAGTVAAVGSGVREFAVGDAVIALAPFSFGTHVTTSASLVVRKPETLTFEDAAAIPVVFLTAYYALMHLGRLSAGESILIHSASGGTGLAAVQLAQRAGAEIFATAGSVEKRSFLQSLGIRHVMDSRTLDFAEEIMELTGGRGVDLVLNSLTGDAISRSLTVLAPYGRFLEIGKKDIYQDTRIGLQPFQKNLSYFAVDLARMVVERPAFVQGMLSQIVEQFASGMLRPLAVQALPIADAVTGFHTMAQAKHIGKTVFTFKDKSNTPILPAVSNTVTIDAGGLFLITGGLGGLGLIVAEWLVEQGARHLLLIGRRAPTASAEEKLDALRAAGARIIVAQADVAEREQLSSVLSQPGLPPLRGVIHAAGILEDSTLQRLDATRLENVMRPKIDGAWNLHELTKGATLDFFVLFSSAASVMGSPGQANYSAANAFLDALAHYRRSQGKPAMSINWGPWSEAGLAAAQANRGERLAAQGMASIPPRQGMLALGYLLVKNPAQVAVMPFNVRHWRQLFPRAMRAPFLAKILSEGESPSGLSGDGQTSNPVRLALESALPALRQPMLEAHLTEQIAQVLRMSPTELGRDTPLPALGLDSLMALELRNRLESNLGVILSATLIWGYPTIAALAPFLIEKMGLGNGANAEGPELEAASAAVLSNVTELSEDDAEAMLAEKLNSLDAEYQ